MIIIMENTIFICLTSTKLHPINLDSPFHIGLTTLHSRFQMYSLSTNKIPSIVTVVPSMEITVEITLIYLFDNVALNVLKNVDVIAFPISKFGKHFI